MQASWLSLNRKIQVIVNVIVIVSVIVIVNVIFPAVSGLRR